MVEKDRLILKYKLRSTAGGRQANLSKKSSQKTLSKSPIRKINGKTIFTQTPSSFVLQQDTNAFMQNNSLELKNIQLELKSQINQNNEFLDLIHELEQEKVKL